MQHRRPRHRLLSSRDDGSAPVEFALVSVLVVALFAGVVQLALVLHMRNVVTATAAEAARVAANADRSCDDGAEAAHRLLADALSERVARDLEVRSCSLVRGQDVTVVELRLEARLPLLFFPGGDVTVGAVGHAVQEGG